MSYISLGINNFLIKNTRVHKVLGVYLDSPKMNFNEHIQYLKTECNKRINILRSLTGVKWGSTKKLLRRVYISFIRSKMEYASSIYGELSQKNLITLEVLQNKALRCILGARQTSPIVSMEVEAYIFPVDIRFKRNMIRRYLKYQHAPKEDSLRDKVLGNIELGAFHCKAKEFAQEMGLNMLQTVHTQPMSPIPPEVDMDKMITLEWNNSNTQVHYSNGLFLEELQEMYEGFVPIYTDGSKYSSGSSAAAMYIPKLGLTTGWKLNPGHTILGAELFAILQAIQFANLGNLESKIVVLTDSRVALSLIRNNNRPHYSYIVHSIQKLLLDRGINTIKLQWVKLHSDITGNNIADMIAKKSHDNNKSVYTKLSFEESWNGVQNKILEFWQNKWHQTVVATQKGTFLRSIRDEIGVREWGNIPRILESAVTRLRIGHVGVGAHLNRFNMSNSSLCELCRVNDDVNHFVLHCRKYEMQRRVLKENLRKLGVNWELRTILGEGKFTNKINLKIIHNLGIYLRETNQMVKL